MGLKDMFRRKSGRRDGKPSSEPDESVRQSQDATVVMTQPLPEEIDETAILLPIETVIAADPSTTGQAADEATVMIQNPIGEAEPAPLGDSNVAVEVEVEVPAFSDAAGAPPPAAASPEDLAATVAVSILDFDGAATAPLQPAPAAGDFSATVAVPIPDFERPAAPEAPQRAEGPARDATRFERPVGESERPTIAGVLVAIDGELAGVICPIYDGETKIGRSEECDVALASMKISREHTTIVHQDGVFAILPLSDKNPTYVNDEVVSGCELSDGDSVRMGRTTFRFRIIEGL